jgi:ParB-like chromosome segregation protein Spo0J
VPVVVDADDNVLAGHARIAAALRSGRTEMPTICIRHLTEAQARAFTIADNRLTEIATWDNRLLAEQLKMLAESELDFSIEVTGSTMAEIDVRIEGLTEQPGDDDPADALSEPQTAVCVTRPGDGWMLGDNLITAADALDDSMLPANA